MYMSIITKSLGVAGLTSSAVLGYGCMLAFCMSFGSPRSIDDTDKPIVYLIRTALVAVPATFAVASIALIVV